MEIELISMSELARRRGVHKATMARHVKRLPEECFIHKKGERHPLIVYSLACRFLDSLIDPAKTQEEQVKKLSREAEAEKNNVGKGEPNNEVKKESSEEPKHVQKRKQELLDGLVFNEEHNIYLADDVEIEIIEDKKVITAKNALLSNAERYQKHRSTTEALKAQKLQMELDIQNGKLVDADELKKRIMKVGTETRDAIQNIPAQYGPDLLACTDLTELETMLAHAINKALENLKRLKK